ncbi:hypothetical protein SAMN02982989_3366 [Xaviernesmea oryzae]|uniref:Uncharacterized protein n=1 Tax=Xaviernesmea oryzae TaxID=464029 RepID=A0A1X7G7R6_9HYPH|nr:hypothetical protein [Xaviernesmea oryzae]SMF65482.1 hypothetical protein SAMN02982989_3366 [Xaviernesmea oryzae]
MSGSFGPLSQEQFKDLVDAPYGRAGDTIRKFDPLFGKTSSDGEIVKWRIKLVQEVRMVGYVTVEAVNEEEAELAAEAIPDASVSWDFEDADSSYCVEVRRM